VGSRALIKSEIVRAQDLEFDSDTETDLVISSSLMIGNEEAGIELPITIDAYHILSGIQIAGQLSEDGERPDGPGILGGINYPDFSPLHYVSSYTFSVINSFVEMMPQVERLNDTITEVPLFNDIDQLLLLVSSFTDVDRADFTFGDSAIGGIPQGWSWTSTDKLNNKIEVIQRPDSFGRAIRMYQNGNQADTNTLNFDLGDYSKELLGLETFDPYVYGLNCSAISFYYYHDRVPLAESQFKFVFPFDIHYYNTSEGEYQHKTGENGAIFKIEDDHLFWKIGKVEWDGAVYGPPEETPGSWVELGQINSNLLEYDTLLKFIVDFDQNEYNIQIQDVMSGNEQDFTEIPYYMDFAEISDNIQEGAVFYPNNFYKFEAIQDSPTASECWLDNYASQVYNIYDLASDDTILEYESYVDQAFDYLFGASIYNLLIFPEEFDFNKFTSVFQLLNDLFSYYALDQGFSRTQLFDIIKTPERLTIELPIEAYQFLEDFLGLNLQKFVDADITFKIWWDINARMFGGIILRSDYKEIKIVREISCQIVATSRPNDTYPSEIPEDYSLIGNLDISKYTDQILDQYLPQVIGGVVILVGVCTLTSVGIEELIGLIRRKREQ
jgi:hypothetical protein